MLGRGIITNKNKPFLANKGFLENNDISLIEENKVITSDKELTKTFNEYYINIVEKSSGIKPKDISQRVRIRISRKQLGKFSNPMKTILVYCK